MSGNSVFYTTGEIADMLGAHPDTVRKYCDSGELRAEKGALSPHRRIKREELIAFLEKKGISKNIIDRKKAKKILIADDDPSVRDVIMHTIQLLSYPFQIEYADNGHQACIRAGSMRPDIILLDLMMPEMDGFQVLRNLRKDKDTQNIPVLIITAFDNDENLSRLSSLKVTAVLIKPFSIKELQRHITLILQINDTN
ncbi:MAG: hypothetical protein A2293_12955 [Elusimicrobia bacterium RIFOXYB2_FULL_49_7]|nr:MAG: hypothetical protein A2293_12955 [Elusimicrobia bacterium RIFOXYB2_FULL_49_7]